MTPEAFYADLEARFETTALPEDVFDGEFGGHAARIRVRGRELASTLIAAVGHRRCPIDSPALRIDVWESSVAPAWPWTDAPAMRARGDIEHGWNVDVHASYSARAGLLETTWGSRAFAWVRDAGQLEPWQRAAPLRAVFAGLARSRGGALIHAAAVSENRRAALLTAPSGGGKSTTALWCALAGFQLLGDDFVWVADGPAGLDVFSLYSTVKIDPEQQSLLSALGVQPGPRSHGKVVVPMGSLGPERLARRASVAAVIVPHVGHSARAELRVARPIEVLRAALPSSCLLLPHAGPHTARRLTRMLSGLPAYTLALGRDPREHVELVREALHA